VDSSPDTIDCGTGGEVFGDTVWFDAALDKVANNCEDQRPTSP